MYLVRPALDIDGTLCLDPSGDVAGVRVELIAVLRSLLLSGEVSGRDE